MGKIEFTFAQWERHQKIAQRLNRWKGEVVPFEEIASMFEVSDSTVRGDINLMKILYDAPIKNNRKGYFLSADFDVPAYLSINQSDLQSLQAAISTLQDFKGIGIFEHLEGLLHKLKNSVAFKAQSKYTEKLVMFESAPLTVPEDCLNFFWEGILHKKVVQFEYQKFAEESPTMRTVSPHFLREHRNRWYLVCTDHKDQVIKNFGLERTRKYAFQPQALYQSLPAHINPEQMFAKSFGIFLNVKEIPEKVTLQFSRARTDYLKTLPFHSQQLEKHRIEQDSATDGLTIHFDLIINTELVMELAKLGKDVKVIAPESLREKIKKYYQDALDLYAS